MTPESVPFPRWSSGTLCGFVPVRRCRVSGDPPVFGILQPQEIPWDPRLVGDDLDRPDLLPEEPQPAAQLTWQQVFEELDAEALDPAAGREATLCHHPGMDGTARLWNISVDYDFPPEHLPLLVEVSTGTTMDDLGNITVLNADEWKQRRDAYIKIAEAHLKRCRRYRDANLYVRQKVTWGR